ENQGCPWPDVDKDGIFDKDDVCPFEAGDAENKGCPWPDTDSDGLNDKLDACPREAGPIERKGCPFKDLDGDGVDDLIDKCPDVKGTSENFGCPDNTDSDKDGILDKEDKCPAEAGIKENAGCPDVDSDGDGFVDRLDKCPKTPGDAANGGCPALNKEEVKAIQTAFKNLEFERGKDIILPKSFPALLELAKVMKDNPETRLMIEGHSDNQGKEENNLELSKKRALAVRFVIVSKGGVESPRVKVGWFGSKKPIASNSTEAGRA
ncbi:OmpA family protein, partial [Umezakia ovalisporum]|uniref:OmpA family protein n=1 Tax=Umezakia ovalisporum TaxID=75695 RepID=UPI0039C6FB76